MNDLLQLKRLISQGVKVRKLISSVWGLRLLTNTNIRQKQKQKTSFMMSLSLYYNDLMQPKTNKSRCEGETTHQWCFGTEISGTHTVECVWSIKTCHCSMINDDITLGSVNLVLFKELPCLLQPISQQLQTNNMDHELTSHIHYSFLLPGFPLPVCPLL